MKISYPKKDYPWMYKESQITNRLPAKQNMIQ